PARRGRRVVSADERQPWELADEESGRPREAVPPTSEPIEEEDRGKAERRPPQDGKARARSSTNGAPDWNDGKSPAERSYPDEDDVGAGSQYAAEDSEEHSEPKGPAGGAAGP